MSIEAIIFDLGKVICPFSHHAVCEKLTKYSPLTADQIYQEIFKSGLEEKFDEGKIPPQRFYQEVTSVIKAKISLTAFYQIWVTIFSLDEEVAKIVEELKTYKRYLLSNTNEWHFRYLISAFPILQEFDGYILSFEIGVRKPKPAIYQQVLKVCEREASQCLYIDDIKENVVAAENLGFQTIHFIDAKQLRRTLNSFGIKLGAAA